MEPLEDISPSRHISIAAEAAAGATPPLQSTLPQAWKLPLEEISRQTRSLDTLQAPVQLMRL